MTALGGRRCAGHCWVSAISVNAGAAISSSCAAPGDLGAAAAVPDRRCCAAATET